MKLSLALISFLFAVSASATLQKNTVAYTSADGGKLEGFSAFDDSGAATKPAVIIVSDWMGLGDYAKAKAEILAKMGYVAFAADIYGVGNNPKDAKEASSLATKYKENRSILRQRIQGAYEQVRNMKNVDPKKIVVMGYCFGGTTALELARSGVPLAGTASFHGGLANPHPEDAKNIKSPVLVMHGADDPYVPAAEVEAFKKEMKEAKVNYSFTAYKNAVHSFTIPSAGNDNSKGAAYNAEADKQSWKDFTGFLKKVTR